MSASQSSPVAAIAAGRHIHPVEQSCPLCDQPIPNHRLEEIRAKLQAKERENALRVEECVKDQVAQEKARIDAQARLDVEKVRQDASAALETAKREAQTREEAVRQEARDAAEAAATLKIAGANSAKEAAEQRANIQLAEFQRLQQESLARENTTRNDAQAAIAGAAKRLAELDEGKRAAEQLAKDNQLALDKAIKEAAERAAGVREEGRKAGMVDAAAKIAEAEAGKKTAEQRLEEAKEGQETAVNARLKEQREALEKANNDALNAEKARAFEEKLKIEERLQAVTRQLQQKSAEDLGEGAEIDLYEALREEHSQDKIVRVGKGAPGADIIQDVTHNGRTCGRIVYDSKNRNVWRNDYVTKLRQDQLAANGEHAILSSHVFPAGTRQLHIQDGILIANPARVLAVVALLRNHLIQMHAMRASNEARSQKTAQMYTFITSERANQLLTEIEARSDDMLDLEVKEKKAHDSTWKKRGELIRGVQRARADFAHEVDRIIGTGPEQDKLQ